MDKKKMKNKDYENCDHECCGGDKCCGCKSHSKFGKGSCGVYGLGFVGAAIYYISTATSFWMGVLGILKACVWPAFLAYEALKFFGA